jgi:hypothetical protein
MRTGRPPILRSTGALIPRNGRDDTMFKLFARLALLRYAWRFLRR